MRPEGAHEKKRYADDGRYYDAAGDCCCRCRMVCIALLLTFGHALIGFVDDYIKVVMKRNLGLTAAQKFFMQFVLAGAYVYYIETHVQGDLSIAIPGTEYMLPLGWLYYVLVFLLLVGTTNAVHNQRRKPYGRP